MAVSKPTNGIFILINNFYFYYLFKNLKNHFELFLIWQKTFLFIVQLTKKFYKLFLFY